MTKRTNPTGIIFCSFFLLLFNQLQAQADTTLQTAADINTKATFKGTYILNTPSIQQVGKGVLQVMIMHRFGKISNGAYELFGLDNATIRLGLDYGISNRLMVTVGRSSFQKTYDAALKYRVMSQTTTNSKPVSIGINLGLLYNTFRFPEKPNLSGKDRMHYFTQLLIARKFSNKVSVQITPSWLHDNLASGAGDKNNQLVIGAGGRCKITKRLSINAEYNYLLPNQIASFKVHNALSAGLDIETGGHVFQFVFSNSRGLVPNVYLANTTDTWADGGIYFGFNIARVFSVGKATRQ
jgi:Membrane bound beta barrel domain (DUF5777)